MPTRQWPAQQLSRRTCAPLLASIRGCRQRTARGQSGSRWRGRSLPRRVARVPSLTNGVDRRGACDTPVAGTSPPAHLGRSRPALDANPAALRRAARLHPSGSDGQHALIHLVGWWERPPPLNQCSMGPTHVMGCGRALLARQGEGGFVCCLPHGVCRPPHPAGPLARRDGRPSARAVDGGRVAAGLPGVSFARSQTLQAVAKRYDQGARGRAGPNSDLTRAERADGQLAHCRGYGAALAGRRVGCVRRCFLPLGS
mmetsp:Transcript_12953/g.29574  ORF Transcript_12953/g.29574 Transcript_12953/m.29574 type:complete len:256 (-) Transcript_12953:377-1144(-)